MWYNGPMKRNLVYKILILAFAVAITGIAYLTLNYYTCESYMSLNGDSKVTIGLNGLYDDEGVTAVIHGKDVSDSVEVSGNVDTTVPGDYTTTYKAGNFTLERKVTVLDVMDPVIELKGEDKPIKIKLGEEFKEPGFTAHDSNGNDLTASVKVENNEFTSAGEQKVEYIVSDSEGKATRVYRTVTVEPNTEYKTCGIPICMYHYVYDENNVPADVNANYISVQDLSEELQWLKDQDYYFPTWDEVRDYIDGKLLLPEKSIVLTFDDGAVTFLKNGIPVLEKYQVPATSFVITSKDGPNKVATYKSPYVTFESHSDNMHRGGGNIGHGGIMTAMSVEDGVADLKKSIEIVGNDHALAYPFGDYNDSCVEMAKKAGFKVALTTRQGRAKPGDDPYKLPRQRMSRNQTMETFRAMVLPY